MFATAYAKPLSVKKLPQALLGNTMQETYAYNNTLHGKGYNFTDSEHIRFHAYDLFYTHTLLTQNLEVGVDAGIVSIEQKDVAKYQGKRYGIHLNTQHFYVRLGMNLFDDFSEFVPTLRYNNSYQKHNYSLEYTHQNALFATFSLCPYEQRISMHHLSISDYLPTAKNTDLWSNMEYNIYDNSNKELTAQFDWRFFYATNKNKKFSYHLALEGWYTHHSKPNSCYYSPNFSDATMVRIDPKYIFSKYLGIKARAALGYSFKDVNTPFKVAAYLFAHPQKQFSYDVGCLYSNAARLSAGSSYSYRECRFNMEYKW